MKYLIIIFSAIIFISCNDESNTLNQEFSSAENNVLSGKWKLVEYLYSIGDDNLHSNSVENGYYYNFKGDGTFISDRLEGCAGGTYEIQEDQLVLLFDCSIENNEYVEKFSFKDNSLFLCPVSPTACIEGCAYKFKKIE